MKTKFTIGQKVRSKISKEAYYSGYAGNPVVTITPDMVGTIGSLGCPAVRGTERRFHCVDYVIPEVFSGNPIHGNNVWRASFYEDEIETVKESP